LQTRNWDLRSTLSYLDASEYDSRRTSASGARGDADGRPQGSGDASEASDTNRIRSRRWKGAHKTEDTRSEAS